MEDLAVAARLFIPGAFEDAFLYMDGLFAVTLNRELVTANYSAMIEELVSSPPMSRLARLLLARNDWLAQEGTRELLAEPVVQAAILEELGGGADERLLLVDDWDSTFAYERLVGPGTVLDLQIYKQRLFAATTTGLLETEVFADGGEVEFSQARKRTDARCLSLAFRYGAVAASCGVDGLQVGLDDFGELDYRVTRGLERESDSTSVRSSWLGHSLVNYVTSSRAEALRGTIETARQGARATSIVTHLEPDESLLAAEQADWVDADFVFNAHTNFFVHFESGRYELRRRSWSRGRLGHLEIASRGELGLPLSVHELEGGMVVETYDAVLLVTSTGVSTLFDGECVAIRTFANSKRYRNLVVIVTEAGLHVISPLDMSRR